MDFEPDTSNLGDARTDEHPTPRILVFVSQPETMTVAALVEAGTDWTCQVADSLDTLHGKLVEETFDVVLLPSSDCDEEIAGTVRRLQPSASFLVAAGAAGIEEVTRTMRLGASDFLRGDLDSDQVEERLFQAVSRSRENDARKRLGRRIAELSRRLDQGADSDSDSDSDSGASVEDQVVPGPTASDDSTIEMCSEFRTLIRQELDVEDLLRTSLEYLLVKTGPTNAAVFLAGGDGRFGLGAYVNYEHSRRSVEPMLQRLSDEACPRMTEEQDILRFEDASAFIRDCDLGEDVPDDVEMIAIPCRHDGECLAMMFMFRDASNGFDDAVGSVLDSLRGILAEQLATLIRVHNRMEQDWPEEPEDEWNEFEG